MKIQKRINFWKKNHHIKCEKYSIQFVKKYKDLMKIRKGIRKPHKFPEEKIIISNFRSIHSVKKSGDLIKIRKIRKKTRKSDEFPEKKIII